MYNVDVKEVVEKLISYFSGSWVIVGEDELVHINVFNSNIRSLEEIGYILSVERVKDFTCNACDNLKDLRGCPREVYGNFDCSYCKNLSSLEGSPRYVKGDFRCISCNNLKDLNGGLREVGGNFNCSWCDGLKEIKFEVDVIEKSLICMECRLLEYIDEGVIRKVKGRIYVYGCENIKGIDKLIKKFDNKIEREYVYV